MNLEGKNSALKRRIIEICMNEGDCCIADLSRELDTSIPTVTGVVSELIDSGFLEELGKKGGTNGGRRPSVYGLNPAAGFFVGVDIHREDLSFAVMDFRGQTVDYQEEVPFELKSTEESFVALCTQIKQLVANSGVSEDRVVAYGVNLTGRVNNVNGYSFTYFLGEDCPLPNLLQRELGASVFIENDSRAMTYGEYVCGVAGSEKDMLFINVSWGLGMGMVIDGKLYYGKSGFSGEIGHFPMLDNETMCHCGKIGCLETGASGSATHRLIVDKLRQGRVSLLAPKFAAGEEITLDDIIDALNEEDVLAIETVEEIGTTLGRAIAGLINIFNPELVVIGGVMSAARDYLMLPIRAAVQKHSLNIVSRDTNIRLSRLGKRCGAIGACVLARSRALFE